MEGFTDSVFMTLLQSIDIMYILMCNVVCYLTITTIQSFKKKKVAKSIKRIISAVEAVGLGLLCVFVFHHNAESVFYCFFLQFLVYDYLWKYIIKWFKGLGEKIDDKLDDK